MAGNMEDIIKDCEIFGIQKLRRMRSSMLRPRRNVLFSSIYLHDLPTRFGKSLLVVFSTVRCSSGKNILIVIYPLPILFGLFTGIFYSKISFGLLFSDSGRDNTCNLAPGVSALGSGLDVNIYTLSSY